MTKLASRKTFTEYTRQAVSLYPSFYSIELVSFSFSMGAESRLGGRRQESAKKFTLGDDPAKNTRLNEKSFVSFVNFVVHKLALNWLCIGFELALFFLTSQLPILAYQSIKKALTAIFQMLRLALFSQTKPFSNRPNPKDTNDEFFYEFGNKGAMRFVFMVGKCLKVFSLVDRLRIVKNSNLGLILEILS